MNKKVKQKYYRDAINHLSGIISYINEKKQEEDKPDKLTFFLGRFYYINESGENKTGLLNDGLLLLPFVGRFVNGVTADINPKPTTHNIDDILKFCITIRDSLAKELERLNSTGEGVTTELSNMLLKKIDKYFESKIISPMIETATDNAKILIPQFLKSPIEELNSDIRRWYENKQKAIKTKIKNRVGDIYDNLDKSQKSKQSKADFAREVFPHIKHNEKSGSDNSIDWNAEQLIKMLT